MTPAQMNAVVGKELRQIPRGPRGSAQRMYRSVYNNYRLNSLGAHPEVHSTEDAHDAARRIVRQTYPKFEPVITVET